MPERHEASAGMFAYIDRKVRIEETIADALEEAFQYGFDVAEQLSPRVDGWQKEKAADLLKAIREIDGEWVDP